MVIGKSVKLALQGTASGLGYRMRKNLNKHQYPTFLVYQLTNACNSRCRMCNIWQKDTKGELRLDEITSVFRNKMFSKLRWINLTGGEPFLRSDIVDVVKILAQMQKMEGIAIPSNGFNTAKILRDVKKILKILKKNQFLSITLSIDGFEKTHDDIRGVPGAYKKVMKTFRELQKIKNKNFNVGVQPTISKRNLDEIEDFYADMKKTTKSIGYAVMLTSEGYYDNTDSDLSLSKTDKKKVAGILKRAIKQDPQYGFYYSKLIQMFSTGVRDFGCLGGYLTVYMDPKGNISPCPVLSSDKRYTFGSAKQGNIIFSKKSTLIRNQLKTEPACEKCSMMCDFINFAKVEFIEHSIFMLQNPKLLNAILKKAKNNPYF